VGEDLRRSPEPHGRCPQPKFWRSMHVARPCLPPAGNAGEGPVGAEIAELALTVNQIPSPAEAEPQKIEGALKDTRMNFP
jgi:hypothetical protein